MNKYCYAIVTKKGNLIIESGHLPIFWYKDVAEGVARTHGGIVIKIKSSKLMEIISNDKIEILNP